VIAKLLPDVLAKGGDWPGDQIVGREEVEAAGGHVVSIPFVPGYSTTTILKKIWEGAEASDVNEKAKAEESGPSRVNEKAQPKEKRAPRAES